MKNEINNSYEKTQPCIVYSARNLIFEEFFTQNKPVNIHLKNIEEILRIGIF